MTLLLASSFLKRGHSVDLLLRDLVCDFPTMVPDGVRLFFLSRGRDSECQSDIGRLPVKPRSLIPATPPGRLRFPRLALARSVHRRQLPLLASSSLPRWAVTTAAYVGSELPHALLAMLTPAVVTAALAVSSTHHRPRVVGALHNAIVSSREYRRACQSYPFVDAAVGVSAGVCSELNKLPGIRRNRIHTVYNPVVSADLLEMSQAPVGDLWLEEPGPPVVVAIGRLHKQKDFSTLLAAFSLLLGKRSARLIVLGSGPLRADLESLAHELRIGKHVKFPGFVENPYAFLSRASLFVLSSRYEGLSNVLIEAMACGCPVVSTSCKFGPDEILEGGRWGRLVPVGDPEALAVAMLHTLAMPPRRDTLRERARFFSVDNAVRHYEELLFEP